jgi:MSHA biogenesis protein MshG
MKEVIQDVRESLEAGRELSVSLARHPEGVQSFLHVHGAGRRNDRPARRNLHAPVRPPEFERFMREQVKSALRYPMFVVIAMAVAIVIVNIFVIPAFAKVFKGFGAELPLMTRLLLGFSDFMVAWWPAMLVGIVATVLRLQRLGGNEPPGAMHLGSHSSCAFRLPARSSARRRWPALPAASRWPCAAACRSCRR